MKDHEAVQLADEADGRRPLLIGVVLGGLGSSMLIEVGHVKAIFRYPVKSMGGERLEAAELGWHGLDGDRRLAFRRIDDRSGFPWLTASKLPDLLLFAPHRREDGARGDLPTHVRTPDGDEMPVFGEDLATEVERRYGAPVQMMQLNQGIFDEANLSVIAFDTVRELGRLAGQRPDVRRFRPNVVVRANQDNAGIYGAVTRIGRLAVGQTILLCAATEKRERG